MTCECGSRVNNVTARSQKSTRSPAFDPNPMNTVSIEATLEVKRET
jgi:hypothetical protein